MEELMIQNKTLMQRIVKYRHPKKTGKYSKLLLNIPASSQTSIILVIFLTNFVGNTSTKGSQLTCAYFHRSHLLLPVGTYTISRIRKFKNFCRPNRFLVWIQILSLLDQVQILSVSSSYSFCSIQQSSF